MKSLVVFTLLLVVGILIWYFSIKKLHPIDPVTLITKSMSWVIYKSWVVIDLNKWNQEELSKRYDFLRSFPTSVNSVLAEEYNDLSTLISGECNQKNLVNIQLCKDYTNKIISTNVNYSDVEKLLLAALIAGDRNLCKGNIEAQDAFDRINFIKNPLQVAFPTDLNDNDNKFYLFFKINGATKYLQTLDQLYKANILNHE